MEEAGGMSDEMQKGFDEMEATLRAAEAGDGES